jgi:hypothetical protein
VVVTERRRAPRGARSWVGALAAASLLLIALAVPMDAASTKTKLSAAAVSPRSGTPTTRIEVAVVYQNANGSRAEQVNVAFAALTYQMARVPGGSWGKGVTFKWSGTLPAGRHAVVIRAVAKDNSTAALAAGTVTITAPVVAPPPPTPKPKPTDKPTPTPAPKATPKPPIDGSAMAVPTPTPTIGALVFPTEPPIPTGMPTWMITTPTPDPTAPPLTAAALGGAGPGGPDAGGSDGSNDPAGPVAGSDAGDAPAAWGPLASVLAIAGLQPPTFNGFGLAPTLVTTTGAVAAALALGLFGRRRREDDLPDDVLAAAAAHGVKVAAFDAMASGQPGMAGLDVGELDSMDMEALLPRWRRPSLLQARKADPVRDVTPASRLTFDEGLVGPIAGRERRVVRYRVVRLLDSPDELRGVEIGFLDHGDEVQVIEKYGAYCLVVAPDGQQGWLHKMTLGEMADADGPSGDRPTASMPIAADSWTMGESDIDSDVLEAYLESRRRNA